MRELGEKFGEKLKNNPEGKLTEEEAEEIYKSVKNKQTETD